MILFVNVKNLVFSHRPLYVHCTSTVRPLYVHCTSTAHTANDGDDGADEVVDGAEVCYDDEQERDNEDETRSQQTPEMVSLSRTKSGVSLLARRRLRPPRVPWGPGKRSADYDDDQLPDVRNADQHDVGDD